MMFIDCSAQAAPSRSERLRREAPKQEMEVRRRAGHHQEV